MEIFDLTPGQIVLAREDQWMAHWGNRRLGGAGGVLSSTSCA